MSPGEQLSLLTTAHVWINLPAEPMVVTLRVAMLDVFAQEITKGPRAEDHKVIEIFCPDRSDKPFGGGLRLMLDTQFVGPTYRF